MTAQQLKNSILKLAISGKLVPQDPNDEPASVLIEKIRKEKEKLIKDGKLKKEKTPSYIFRGSDNMPYEKVGDNEPVCIADEVPFEIPGSWEWCRLNAISYMVGNKYNQIKTSEIKKSGEIPVVSQGQSLIDGFSNEKSKIINDVPLIMFGDHTKNVKYIDFPFVIGADGTKFHKIILCNDKYIYFWMIYTTINIVDRGYARHHSLLLQEFLPLPPLQEQQRIVSEIEKYLPLINEYDKLQTELDSLNIEFPEKLKKSILQQAIKGKLVEQDPSDEPASVLLDKIRKEKEKLIKEGKIKKDKNESIIYKRDNSYYEKLNGVEKCIDDEIPFEIPENWEWCRFGQIVINYDNKRKPISKNNRKSLNGYYEYYGATGSIDRVDEYIFNGQFLMIGEDGGNFFTERDNSFIASGKFWANNHVHVVQPIDIDIWYLKFFLDSCNLVNMGLINGIAVPKLNQSNLNSIIVSIPPLSTQQRIVCKVKNLLFDINKLQPH